MTTTDIKLRPSNNVDWNINMINILKQLATVVRVRTDIKLWPSGRGFPQATYTIRICIASHNELYQLHMQVLLNCHLAMLNLKFV